MKEHPTLTIAKEWSGEPNIIIGKADAFTLIERLTNALAYCTLLDANGVFHIKLNELNTTGTELSQLIRFEVRP